MTSSNLKIISVVEKDDGFCLPIYDWDNSETEWCLTHWRIAESYADRDFFRYPVKIIAMPNPDYSRLHSHIAVRTDIYPLLWMWAWFVEKTREIADHDFWVMMRFAYATGLARYDLGRYPSVRDFIFWPKR